MMEMRILMMLLRMTIMCSDKVTGRRTVMVTGFDNHNNREVAREVPVPLVNNFEKFSHKSVIIDEKSLIFHGSWNNFRPY